MAEETPVLARLLGADRYLRMLVFAYDRPGAVLALAVLPVAVLGAWLISQAGRWTPLPATHDGFMTARVLFSEPIASDDADITYRFRVALPDETRAVVQTSALARAMTVVDVACVERLVDDEGAPHYRLAWPQDCE